MKTRTIEQAEKECYAAWAAQPDATHGWCVHHEKEFEELTEPIANRIAYIVSEKSRGEILCRLDNLRPVSPRCLSIVLGAEKAYQEATAPAWKAYQEAKATAAKAYQEATAPAAKAYHEATATAEKAYQEATAPAAKAYQEAKAPAEKAYQEATAPAHRHDVPNNTWNGSSIFKQEISL